MKKLICFVTMLSGFYSYGSIGRTQYCAEANMQSKLSSRNNRLSFTNQGGLFNSGVCWWHSRFTRNANYLAFFSPNKPPLFDPTELIKKIRKGREVVEIPGFRNLREFSTYYQNEIQDVLENWQIVDGAINQQWVVGLWGKSEVSESNMKKRMDKLHARVSNGEVVYQKLQIDGIDAHAWLVVGMEKFSGGYNLYVVDSNYRGIDRYVYKEGDRSFEHPFYGKFVPYTGRMAEERRLNKVKNKFGVTLKED